MRACHQMLTKRVIITTSTASELRPGGTWWLTKSNRLVVSWSVLTLAFAIGLGSIAKCLPSMAHDGSPPANGRRQRL